MSLLNQMKVVTKKGAIVLGAAACAFNIAAAEPAMAEENSKVFVMDVTEVGQRVGSSDVVCKFSVKAMEQDQFLKESQSGNLNGSYVVPRQYGSMIPVKGNDAKQIIKVSQLVDHTPGVDDEKYEGLLKSNGPTNQVKRCRINFLDQGL